MNLKPYEVKHWQNIQSYMNYTDRAFFAMIARITKIYDQVPSGVPFDLNNLPGIKRAIELELRKLAQEINSGIVNGINREWALSNAKNDIVTSAALRGRKLPSAVADRWNGRNLDALSAFQKQNINGLTLSGRVWNIIQGQSVLIEQQMALGIKNGTSASSLATEMKQYLNNPNALFRRVRDEAGDLKLSQVALKYNPGQGVYRSAYKNALILTRTETNRAYQKADAVRWKKQDFVIGVRVQRSAVPYPCDICDAGVGLYPKDYEWDLWHPNCRCNATPELAPDSEIDSAINDILDGKEPEFSGYVEGIPKEMQDLQEKGFVHYGH